MNRLVTLSRARHSPVAGSAFGLYLWATLAGLVVPLMVVLLGAVSYLIDHQRLDAGGIVLGQFLHVPVSSRLVQSGPLGQMVTLVALGFATATALSAIVWRHRVVADQRARRIVRQLHERLLDQSLRRAEIEGASAQAIRAGDLIGRRLPALQEGLSLWFRVMPRSVLTFVACFILALSVHVWLTLLAVVTGVVLYKWLLRLRRREIGNMVDWEVPRYRDSMANLVGRAPMLARLQTPGLTHHAYQSQTEALYRRLEAIDRRNGRVWPLVFLAVAAAMSVFVLGLAVNSFEGQQILRLPSALVLVLSLGACALAASRLLALKSTLPDAGDASDLVFHYLQKIGDAAPTEQRVELNNIRDGVVVEDVSLHDSVGRPLLSNFNLTLKPSSMVSVLGTEPISCRAFAELLMGFGTPDTGKVTVDHLRLSDVHPRSLAENVMWIEPDGPIWDGTIVENVRGNNEQIHHGQIIEVLQSLDVYERLHRLPDGLSTIITGTDNDLGADATYAIAVARAVLHRTPIVLVSEPPPPAEHLSHDPCLQALRGLADAGSLVVILPKRLSTLRQSDRVVLLHGPRGAGEGTHASLLAESDLYRHLNYVLFNPYRGKAS